VSWPATSMLEMTVVPVVWLTVEPAGMQTWSAAPGVAPALQFAPVCHEDVPAPPVNVVVATLGSQLETA
jgi:hypothetical protein